MVIQTMGSMNYFDSNRKNRVFFLVEVEIGNGNACYNKINKPSSLQVIFVLL